MDRGEERANPSATVAILCPYIFFASAFEDVVKRLPHAEIIPDFTAAPSGKRYPEEAKARFRAFLNAQSLPWRDIEQTDLSPSEFFSKYGTLVAPFYGGWAQHAATQSHRKARIFYGGAKDLWAFSLQNVYFDRIFTPGPYFTDTLNGLYGKHGTEALSTGEPKLDLVARTDRTAARAALGLSGERPVVLVALTWGALSAFPRVAGALVRLCDRFDIVFKVHHMVEIYEPETLRAFEGSAVRIIGQATPIALGLAAADVVLSDGSGAIFDTLLADRPIVLCDTIGEGDDAFFAETPFYGTWQGRLTGVSTSRDSLEQVVKQRSSRVGPVVSAERGSIQPETLAEALFEAIERPEQYRSARERVLGEKFLPLDGMAAERVAEGITGLARVSFDDIGKSNESLLSRLVRDFEERHKENVRARDNAEVKALQEKLDATERIRKLPLGERLKALAHEFLS